MGTIVFDEESCPSILVRYNSDNESTDRVIPASPSEIHEHLLSQRQTQASAPPVAPVVRSSITPIDEDDDDDDGCGPSILVRYNSDNESPDRVFPADPRLVYEHNDTQHQPPQPPAPPASPISGVTTPSTTTLPDFADFERALTPEPTFDSPAPEHRVLRKHSDIPELPLKLKTDYLSEHIVTFEEHQRSGSLETFHNFQDPQVLSENLLESVKADDIDLESGLSYEALGFRKPNDSEKRDKASRMMLLDGLKRNEPAPPPRRSGGRWLRRSKRIFAFIKKALYNLQRRVMDWVLAYSGRPSDRGKLNRHRQGPSRTEIEMKEAEDYVNGNSHIPLEELAEMNRQFQVEKSLEYDEKRARKPPTLEEQPRGENGRIIFSQEYMDFMTYQDMRPLIDLRVLQHTAVLIERRIKERDEALKLAEEEKLRAEKEGPPTSSTTNTTTTTTSTA